MSYCRFSENSDLYIYPHVYGGFECCMCSLAKPSKTIFTVGCKDHPIFGNIPPCKNCGGKGCNECMRSGSMYIKTRSELINHVKEHIVAGHLVPDHVIQRIQKELEELGEENKPINDKEN